MLRHTKAHVGRISCSRWLYSGCHQVQHCAGAFLGLLNRWQPRRALLSWRPLGWLAALQHRHRSLQPCWPGLAACSPVSAPMCLACMQGCMRQRHAASGHPQPRSRSMLMHKESCLIVCQMLRQTQNRSLLHCTAHVHKGLIDIAAFLGMWDVG